MNIPSQQDFSNQSNIFDPDELNALYTSLINETFVDIGRDITLHLRPQISVDTTITTAAPPQRYNPILGGVSNPISTTRNPGTQITHRDVVYRAHIKIGPSPGDDLTGIGDLKNNEANITIPIEAMDHLKETLSVSIEGRRYSVVEDRPVGFMNRAYIIVKLREINEIEVPSPDRRNG